MACTLLTSSQTSGGRRRRGIAAVALAITLTVSGAGCARPNRTPTLTHDEAVEMVERTIRDAAAHLEPAPRLERYGSVNAPCSGPNDDRETGLVMYELAYWLRDLDPAHNQRVFNQLNTYWQDNGYEVVLDMGDKQLANGRRVRVAEDRTTGFSLKITQSVEGELSLSSQSPCVPEPAN